MNTWLIILAVSILLGSYAGMHYYLYRKLRWIFPRHRKTVIATLLIFATSLIMVQFLSHAGYSRIAMPVAWVSFFWTGYVFIFFALAGSVDLATQLLSFLIKQKLLAPISQRSTSTILSAIALVICVAGFISAQQINIQSFTLTTTKLQQPITIVQISDLHLGMLSNKAHIQQLVNKINTLQADIIVSTGDLVDMEIDSLNGFSDMLANLKARLGKFAVYGNHEAIAGLEQSKAFTERAGFTILSNQGATLDQRINVVGIDDPAVNGSLQSPAEREKQLLKNVSTDLFTLYLKHQPVLAPQTRGLFDLQLSGHTHGGQIFPFSLLTKLFYHAPFGLSPVGAESWLYVSKGTGTWGPPMRVLANPELSVFYLQPKIAG